MTERCDRYFTS